MKIQLLARNNYILLFRILLSIEVGPTVFDGQSYTCIPKLLPRTLLVRLALRNTFYYNLQQPYGRKIVFEYIKIRY